MPKRIIGILLKLTVTVGLFVLLFRPHTFGLRPDLFGGVTPRSLWNEFMSVSPGRAALWLTFALIIKLSGMLAGVVRWRLLLYGQGLRMPFWYMVQSWFVGRMFGIFLPGTIGLDGYRFYDSAMYTREPIKSATVIAVEKLIGFISLTFLLFLTFPLGFRLLKINAGILAVILCALAVFVAASFLLLLNPRVIQVLASVFPMPSAVRSKIDKLGVAVTAYSRQRGLLLLAVACGLWVHTATAFTFFGTMMAIRAANTSLMDILFASPIMIYGTVLGPSIGGEGIREIVFGLLLGGKSGVSTAVLFSHLGWWVGDVVPFLIGVPIFLLRSRPAYRVLQAQLAEAREQAAGRGFGEAAAARLSSEEIMAYRTKLIDTLLVGIAAGLLAGSAAGLIEAAWIKASFQGLTELSAFWWGPLVYGLMFAGVGLGVACVLAFLYLLADRFAAAAASFALSLGATALCGGVIGVWRFYRDVLVRHAPSLQQMLALAAVVVGVTVLIAILGWFVASIYPRGRAKAAVACVLIYMLSVAGGAGYAALNPPPPRRVVFEPPVKATGPNIVLIVADALRADYLKMYSNDARVDTPSLDAFARDGIRFDRWFSQASWTKPSFATIFSGRYPASHTATSQSALLPEGITTFPEILADRGYFNKGFANNANIYSAFGFAQGFTDYVDLKPRLYFGAKYSASRLAVYEILRHGWHLVVSRLTKKINVTDFYQPADVVTREALTWLDSDQRPKDAPFMLFLHYMDTHDPFMDHARPGVGYARVRLENPDPAKFLIPMRTAYDSEIEYLDRYIGVLLDGLRQRGIYGDAVILFTSDHGEEFYDHKGWWHGQTLFDELIRVPAILKLPNEQKAGVVDAGFARHVDIAPMLLQFAGAKPDAAMPGKSVFTSNGDFANNDIGFVYAENDFENNVMQGIRSRECKLIRANPDNPRGHAPVEAYDVMKDPRELNNLAGENNPCETGLLPVLDQMIVSAKEGVAEPRSVSHIPTEQADQLRGLGYLGNE